MNYAVVIPARYQSSRLPGKPLLVLNGQPMIVRTYRQCVKACAESRVFVATDDDRVAQVCRKNGIKVLMTSSECLTGTDRVAECARQLDATHLINVQGDEPVFPPEDLTTMLRAAEAYPDEVLNGICPIGSADHFFRPDTPKVVCRPDGRLLYMSRAAIPTTKRHEFIAAQRQVCVYAFPRNALEAFAKQKEKTPLERIEDIEILRFLELGWEVRMIPLSAGSVAVDSPEDVELANAAIEKRSL